MAKKKSTETRPTIRLSDSEAAEFAECARLEGHSSIGKWLHALGANRASEIANAKKAGTAIMVRGRIVLASDMNADEFEMLANALLEGNRE